VSVACRYVQRQLAATFFVTATALFAVVVGARFVAYLQDAALGKYGGRTVLDVLWLRLPEFLQLTLPLAAFVATVLVVSRLRAEHEATVLAVAGASPFAMYRWVLAAAFPVAIAVGVLAFVLTPRATARVADVLRAERVDHGLAALTPGEFRRSGGGRMITYAGSVAQDAGMARDVFLAELTDGAARVVMRAAQATQRTDARTGSRFLRLETGRRYENPTGADAVRIVEFSALDQRIDTGEEAARRGRPDATPTLALDLTDPVQAAEWHWRAALPILCVVACALGVGVGRVGPRQGRFDRVVPGLTLFFLYYVALLLNQNLVAEARVPTAFGLWFVHAIFAAIAVHLARRFATPSAEQRR
jgi:lipopolysaccharide export system permease protein